MKRVVLILSLLLPIAMLISSAADAETKLAATIFSYDGSDPDGRGLLLDLPILRTGEGAVREDLDPERHRQRKIAPGPHCLMSAIGTRPLESFFDQSGS